MALRPYQRTQVGGVYHGADIGLEVDAAAFLRQLPQLLEAGTDRKSTRLNSSH